MSDSNKVQPTDEISRSLLVGVDAAGAGLAAFAAGAGKPVYAAGPGQARKARGPVPKAPFDSMRDWVAALEANGLLMRFDRIDQSAGELPYAELVDFRLFPLTFHCSYTISPKISRISR